MRRHRWHGTLGVVLAGALGLWACQKSPEGTVVARVDEAYLTREDVEARIPDPFIGTVSAQEKGRLVENWVEEELLYQEALKQQLDKDPAVAKRISEAVRSLLAAELLERSFQRDADVLEGEIYDYYEAHREDFIRETPEIRVRHILVADRNGLDRVWERLRGGESFDQVAREESIDASAEMGGGLGYFTEDLVNPSFWEACQKAKLGRRTRAATQLGHHVIEVQDRREAGGVRDLLEVRGEIRQRILVARRRAKREEVLGAARIRIPWSVDLEKLGGKPAVSGQQ